MMSLIQYLPQLLSGVMVTLMLTLSSVAIGLILAVLMTIGHDLGPVWVKRGIDGFGFFFRGTPLLVQIFLIYYGMGQFACIKSSILWPILREPMSCAIIALSLNSACYTTVLLQGAIRSVPQNEKAACEAMGMSKWLSFRRIIFPRAFRIALPAYSNEVVIVLKGSSLASTITLLDIMGVTQELIAQTYDTIKFYVIAGILYLILYFLLSCLFKLIFKRKTLLKY